MNAQCSAAGLGMEVLAISSLLTAKDMSRNGATTNMTRASAVGQTRCF
jgi:hypothetical protein